MGKLDGKVAVITGAASGMGRATAVRFAREGAAVVVSDLNSQAGQETISEITAAGGRAVFQSTDVGSDKDLKALFDRALKDGDTRLVNKLLTECIRGVQRERLWKKRP